jgi:ParB family chromosome partitioning protein
MSHKIRVDCIEVVDRIRQGMGDIQSLADSMARIGQLQPIIVYPSDGAVPLLARTFRLVAGARRLEAAKLLGWETMEASTGLGPKTAVELLLAERDENTCRKEFTPSEMVTIGRRLEELERADAKERQEASQAKPGQKVGAQGGGKLPPPSTAKGKTRDRVAAAVGTSPKTYEKAKAVVHAAEAEPERFGDLVKEMDANGKVDGVHKELKRRQAPVKVNPPAAGIVEEDGLPPRPTFPAVPPKCGVTYVPMYEQTDGSPWIDFNDKEFRALDADGVLDLIYQAAAIRAVLEETRDAAVNRCCWQSTSRKSEPSKKTHPKERKLYNWCLVNLGDVDSDIRDVFMPRLMELAREEMGQRRKK